MTEMPSDLLHNVSGGRRAVGWLVGVILQAALLLSGSCHVTWFVGIPQSLVGSFTEPIPKLPAETKADVQSGS